MDRLQELITVLADEDVQERGAFAKMNRSCKICGSTAHEFKNARSEFEYLVSHICQDCQNYYFLLEN